MFWITCVVLGQAQTPENKVYLKAWREVLGYKFSEFPDQGNPEELVAKPCEQLLRRCGEVFVIARNRERALFQAFQRNKGTPQEADSRRRFQAAMAETEAAHRRFEYLWSQLVAPKYAVLRGEAYRRTSHEFLDVLTGHMPMPQ